MTRPIRTNWLCSLLLLLILPVSTLHGQDSFQIVGRVLDAEGKPAKDIEVSFEYYNDQRLQQVNATSDEQGEFKFPVKAQTIFAGCMLKSADSQWMAYQSIFLAEDDVAKLKGVHQLSDITLKESKKVVVLVVDEKEQPVEGAAVIAQGNFQRIGGALTDAKGEAKFFIPDTPLQNIGAVKSKVGVDYRAFESADSEVQTHPEKLNQNFDGKLTLKLNGVREVAVKVLDPDQKPLAGASLRPWLIMKPNRGDHWNLGSYPEFVGKTNENGLAVFDMLPIDQERSIDFWLTQDREDWFAVGVGEVQDERATIKWDGPPLATLKMRRKIKIGGKVFHENGSPAKGIAVFAQGAFRYTDWSGSVATTDDQGEWKMLVKPDGYYLIVARDAKHSAIPYDGVLIMDNEEPPEFDFHLEKAKRIYGKVTGGFTENTYILFQQHAKDYYQLPQAQQLPNPNNSNRGISAFLQESIVVAKDGTFEKFVGPGEYTIFSPTRETQKFTLTDEDESKEFEFEVPMNLKAKVKIVAKNEEDDKPMSNVSVRGTSTDFKRFGYIDAVTNQEGIILVERENTEHYLVARSHDDEFAGFAKLAADVPEIEIVMSPALAAKGTLLNKAGEPIANATLTYGLQIKSPDGLSTMASQLTATTNDEGVFELTKVILGETHVLQLVVSKDENGNANSWRNITSITIFEDLDLGEIISE